MARESPTEAVHEATRDLAARTPAEILAAIHAEDRRAIDAVGAVLPAIERAVRALEATLRGGGRWFYAGAGTSGRMGALDAAELPPTFGTSPELVQAILAGGPEAVLRAREGAEDDAGAAGRALAQRGFATRDAVVAISASGRTPFARGALEYARARRAHTIALTCDPDSPLARAAKIAIAPLVGPEVIAGSTRMKGGLAQKAVLHLLSTAVMVRMGRVEGNRMTRVRPASRKLRRRAVSILMELGELDEVAARELFESSQGDLAAALERARRNDG